MSYLTNGCQLTLFCFKNMSHSCKLLRSDRSMVQMPEIFSVHSELTSHDAAEVITSFQKPSLMETYTKYRASQVAQWKIHLPMQESQEMKVQSPHWEDPLEKEMATHPSILSWKIPCTEGSRGLQSMGSQRVEHDWAPEHAQKYKI